MPILTQRRNQFRKAATILGAIAVLSGIYLLAPIGRDNSARWDELLQKQREAKQLEDQAKPLRKLPELLVKSQADLARFYKERLPARESTVQAEIGKLAAKNHVSLTGAKYETFAVPRVPDLSGLQVEATVSGDYADIADFINALERNKLFFLINGVDLAAAGQDKSTGKVQVQLNLVTLLRPPLPEDLKPEDKKKAESDEEEGD